jgi:hypothetical protein
MEFTKDGNFFIEEKVADIDGLECLNDDNNLQQLLVTELETKLQAFKSIDIETLSTTDLKRWAKWAETVDRNIERVDETVASARKLLTQENLRPFEVFIGVGKEQKMFMEFLKSLPRTLL